MKFLKITNNKSSSCRY